jgi:hypothetical protein
MLLREISIISKGVNGVRKLYLGSRCMLLWYPLALLLALTGSASTKLIKRDTRHARATETRGMLSERRLAAALELAGQIR